METAINIKTWNGYYLQAWNGGAGETTAKGPWAREWETFWIIPVEGPWDRLVHNQRILIRTWHGQILWDDNGTLKSSEVPQAHKEEWVNKMSFTLILGPGHENLKLTNGCPFGLKTNSGLFLCAEQGGGTVLSTNRAWMREWETFYAEMPEQPPIFISLKTYDGKHYFQAQDGGGGALTAKGPWAQAYETFEVLSAEPNSENGIRNGTKIYLRTHNGHFMGIAPDARTLDATANNCSTSATQFTLIVDGSSSLLGNGKTVGFRCGNNLFVSASYGGGGNINMVTVRRNYQTFTAEVQTGNPMLFPGVSNEIKWALIRDTIHVNANLQNLIRDETTFYQVPPGSTILIAARKITQDPGFNLIVRNFHLLVVADEFNMNGGGIITTPEPKTGITVPGAEGEKGEVWPRYGKPGGPGGPGEHGEDGTNGKNVTLLCRILSGGQITSNGGNGGKGGKGGKGGIGGDPIFETYNTGQHTPVEIGSSGGPGGAGGTGGSGGNGGFVVVHMVEGGFGPISVSAGAGGSGGDGGEGGAATGMEEYYGNEWDRGQDADSHPVHAGAQGQKGQFGYEGNCGGVVAYRIADEDWYERARKALGIYAKKWSDYRVRVGDYYHRTYIPAVPGLKESFTHAREEAVAAVQLAPDSKPAIDLAERIAFYKTPFNLPRDVDILPDFQQYEQFVTQYFGIVNSLFETTVYLIENARDTALAGARLRGQISSAAASLSFLQAEVDAANNEIDLVKAEIEPLITKANKLESQIKLKTHYLQYHLHEEQDGISIEDLGTVYDVVMIVVTIYTEGATWYQGLSSCADLIAKAGASLETSTTYGDPDLTKNLSAAAGGLKDLVKKSDTLISKAKTLADLVNSSISGGASNDLITEMKKLVEESVQLAFERARAELRLVQANHQLDAATGRLTQAQNEMANLQQQQNQLSQDMAFYAGILPALLRLGRFYGDILMKYLFYAARAVDIYTLTPASTTLAFHYGHAVPDDEENALAALARSDSQPILPLLGELLLSWSEIPKILVFSDTVREYDRLLSSEAKFFYPAADPAALAAFKTTAEIEFTIPLSFISGGRCEAKIESIRIALIGAQSSDPLISCRLEHSGQAQTLKADGSILTFNDPPRVVSIASTKTDITLVGTNTSALVPSFWGRSPAAKWRLWIEPDVLQNSQVNLSGLQRIQMYIGYRARL